MSEEQHTRQSRADQALAWHVRLNSDAAGNADFASFQTWIADPANRTAYDRLDYLWAEIDVHAPEMARALADKPLGASQAADPVIPMARFRMGRRAWLVSGLAAAAAVAGLVVAPQDKPRWIRYTTTKTETKTFRLADGSLIQMNRGSVLEFAMSSHLRRVRLDGEASFDVVHDPARPFIIAAGTQNVRVIGTEFNILAHAGSTAVTVRRGLVEVASATQALRLGAGQQSVYRGGATIVRRVNPDDAFAWQNGRLIYTAATLGEIVSDLNRYFETPIRTADTGTSSLLFSGVLVLDGEDQVVGRLHALLPLAVTRDERGILLQSQAAP